jgi:retinol dehydrogenase-12
VSSGHAYLSEPVSDHRVLQMLLEHNAKVYVASRDSQKSHDAIKNLKEETGKEAILLPVDLSDLRNVRKAADTFLSKENKLDILINNASVLSYYCAPKSDLSYSGVSQPGDILTKDGYDGQFGINVLSHFHLTTV